jgi:LysR family transcriptional regulator, transcriptional activator of the cysJI operon
MGANLRGARRVAQDDPRLTASAFAQEPLELVVPAGEEVRDWSDLQRIGFINHPDG